MDHWPVGRVWVHLDVLPLEVGVSDPLTVFPVRIRVFGDFYRCIGVVEVRACREYLLEVGDPPDYLMAWSGWCGCLCSGGTGSGGRK